ncbi:MAG: hypothetical protein EG828_10290 [Deltaproteobacteria bacterium]|nr:hypothetical protein [Deltaproteobacteria bacterium]
MYHPTSYRALLALLVLLTFIVSDNTLFFGAHATEEFADVTERYTLSDGGISSSTPVKTVLADHNNHDSDHGSDQNDKHCCSTNHSHAAMYSGSQALPHKTVVSSLNTIEPFTYLPEVFLEPFMPPQNCA